MPSDMASLAARKYSAVKALDFNNRISFQCVDCEEFRIEADTVRKSRNKADELNRKRIEELQRGRIQPCAGSFA